MIAFSDDHRGVHGAEPICDVLPIAGAAAQQPMGDRRRLQPRLSLTVGKRFNNIRPR
jgi:hypothetical protein